LIAHLGSPSAVGEPGQPSLRWSLGEQQTGSILPATSPLAVSVQAGGAEDGTGVDRRDAIRVLTTGAVTAVTGVGAGLVNDSPWQRLVDSLKGERPADPATVTLLEDRTADFFRAEETTSARELLLSLRQHREDVHALAVNTENANLKRRLIATAGETDALTGWLLFDLQRFPEAVQIWQRATDTARKLGDQPLLACVLGYWSYLLADQDNHAGALGLLRDAASQVRGSAAATQSWIAARQAEEAAALRNGDDALHALDQAMTLFDYASPRTERVWTAFFSASRLGSMTVRAYSQLNHPETDAMTRSLISSLLPTPDKVRAIVLADLARSTAVHGDFDRAGSLATEAAPLAVRTETSLATDRLWTLVEILPRHGAIAATRQQLIDQLSGPVSRL
jgi:tetratricopeptide (TPR) repeat protein